MPRPGEPQTPAPRLSRSIERLRREFPGLQPDAVRLDGAAGTLLPEAVIRAIAEALRDSMANTHGVFPASRISTQTESEARRAVADLLAGEPEGVIFGPNMTTLTFRMASTLASGWAAGDEIIVTSLDHDANVRPWLLAAERAGVTIRWAEFDVSTGELAVDQFDELISERTRLVAVTAASNAIGTKPEVRAISDRVHAVGGLIYVDGVHATSHGPIDVRELGADFYACSAYKLFGPHAGMLHADAELLETLHPPKLAPASDVVPDRFEWGTPAFELLAGITAAVDWIAELSPDGGDRRRRVHQALAAGEQHLDRLLARALAGLGAISGVHLLGAARRRTSTVSFVLEEHTPREVAGRLAEQGIAVWDGDNYAYELMHRFGLADRGGAVRASIVLYNDERDVDRLVEAVHELAAS
jgi:cysteine desulfurase family protein (TIGR01976 family)